MKGNNTEGQSAKHNKILDAAAEAFMDLGYTATSIDSIADRMQVTKGNIYYYYRSKMDLFFAVHRRAMESNINLIRPRAEDNSLSAERRLYTMVCAHAMQMMEQTSYQRVTVQGVDMYQTASTTTAQREELQELVDLRAEYEELFTQTIVEGVKNGSMRQADPRLTTRTLLGSLNWITMWYRQRETDTRADREQIAAEIADQLLFGVVSSTTDPSRGDT